MMFRINICFIKIMVIVAATVSAAACDETKAENPAEAKTKHSVIVVFADESYHLKVYPKCLTGTQGYVIRAATMHADEPDTPNQNEPSLMIRTNEVFTKIEFWIDKTAPSPQVNLYFEGDSRIPLDDRRFHFEGPASAGADKTVVIDVQC